MFRALCFVLAVSTLSACTGEISIEGQPPEPRPPAIEKDEGALSVNPGDIVEVSHWSEGVLLDRIKDDRITICLLSNSSILLTLAVKEGKVVAKVLEVASIDKNKKERSMKKYMCEKEDHLLLSTLQVYEWKANRLAEIKEEAKRKEEIEWVQSVIKEKKEQAK